MKMEKSNKRKERIRFFYNDLGELRKVLEYSPDSIYVADKDGTTLFVNKAFERLTGVPAKEVIGRNVYDLEEEGYYKPSVLRLVLEEKRSVSVWQVSRNKNDIIVTGEPVFNDRGELELLISNAVLVKDIEGIYHYIQQTAAKKETIAPEEMIVVSPSMKEILAMVEQVKDTDSTILLTGESGVGKGVLARHIHDSSRRAKHRMVEINCGAIPENLLESELFGYESGAFTGANKTGKEGLVEVAGNGTLMLDEISELPLMLQVKLLKVIQDKQVMRIGGKTPKAADVRIIAASNKDLMTLVKEGKFRADLFYRLNVIPIRIPPLRERPQDIESAALYFIESKQRKYSKSVFADHSFVNELRRYEWPGNMRELENYIERKILTDKTGILTAEDAADIAIEGGLPGFIEETAKEGGTLQEALEKMEERMVKIAYEKHRSSYKVADVLGISQASAYRKIRKYFGVSEDVK